MSSNAVSMSCLEGRRVAVVLLMALLAPGCTLVRDQAQVDPIVASNKHLGEHGQPDPIVPDCSIEKWMDRAGQGAISGIDCKPSAGPSTDTIHLSELPWDPITRRSQAQAELMAYADQVCNDHVAGIYAKNASVNLGFGLLTTLFSGGAAVASGRAATNLAAESALFSGSRSMINSEIYYGYIGPAVMTEIRSLRADLRAQIVAKRRCGVDQYPPQEAIGDALIYHDACSFSTGLASLLSKAGTTRVGEDKLRSAQKSALDAQVKEKKTELEDAKKAKTALSAADMNSPKAKDLDARIAELQQDIKSLEGLQRYIGVIDPDPSEAPAAPAKLTLAEELQQAEKHVTDLAAQSSQQKAGSPDKKKTDDELAQATTLRNDLRHQSIRAGLLPFEIEALHNSLENQRSQMDALSKEVADLAGALEKTPKDAALKNTWQSAKTRLDRLSDTIASGLVELDKKKSELRSLGVADAAQSGFPFGIQACAPLKLQTMH